MRGFFRTAAPTLIPERLQHEKHGHLRVVEGHGRLREVAKLQREMATGPRCDKDGFQQGLPKVLPREDARHHRG